MSKGKRGPYGPRKPKIEESSPDAPIDDPVESAGGIVAMAEPPHDPDMIQAIGEMPLPTDEPTFEARQTDLAEREAEVERQLAEIARQQKDLDQRRTSVMLGDLGGDPVSLAGPNTAVRKYRVRITGGPDRDNWPEPWVCIAVDESEATWMFAAKRGLKDGHRYQLRTDPA